MATLRELDQEAAALAELLADMGGDVSDEEAERIIDQWLHENEKRLAEKIDGYATLIRTAEGKAKVRLEEADRLTKLAAIDTNMAERMKKRLRHFMEEKLLTRLDGKYYRVSLRTNGGVQGVEVLVPADSLPKEYQRIAAPEADMGKLRAALERAPDELAGIARFKPRGKHVDIR